MYVFRFEEGPSSVSKAYVVLYDVLVLYDVHVFSHAIDDAVFFSSSWEEHVSHLKCVLQEIEKAGLTLHPDKCEWGSCLLQISGIHRGGRGRKRPDDCQVAAIRDFPTKSAVRSFLGVAGSQMLLAAEKNSV